MISKAGIVTKIEIQRTKVWHSKPGKGSLSGWLSMQPWRVCLREKL